MQNLVFLYAVVFVMLNILVDITIALLDPEDPPAMTHDRPTRPPAAPPRRRSCGAIGRGIRAFVPPRRRSRPSGA